MVLLVALLLIVGFTAIFWQRHQWDQLEQRYQELLNRRSREAQAAAGSLAATNSPDPVAESPAASDLQVPTVDLPTAPDLQAPQDILAPPEK